MTEMGFLGIDHVPFNYRLRDARLRQGWSRYRLAVETGITPTSIGKYEALKVWPPAPLRQRIADALHDAVDYLFPPEVGVALRGRTARTTTSVLPFDTLALDAPELRRLAAPDVFKDVDDRARTASIAHVLETLSDRDRRLIQKRFGLDGEPPQTMDEIAREWRISQGRVHQIEQRALRRLRTPTRAKYLRDFI